MLILLEAITNPANPAANPSHPMDLTALTIVVIVGFVAAAGLGSIAWYNSKRPPGWESKERPDFVPDIDSENPNV